MGEGNTAIEDTEYLSTFYGPVAFLDAGKISGILSGPDVAAAASQCGVPLLPLTLEEQMGERPQPYAGPAAPTFTVPSSLTRALAHQSSPCSPGCSTSRRQRHPTRRSLAALSQATRQLCWHRR